MICFSKETITRNLLHANKLEMGKVEEFVEWVHSIDPKASPRILADGVAFAFSNHTDMQIVPDRHYLVMRSFTHQLVGMAINTRVCSEIEFKEYFTYISDISATIAPVGFI